VECVGATSPISMSKYRRIAFNTASRFGFEWFSK
jgi:hypothetical protein